MSNTLSRPFFQAFNNGDLKKLTINFEQGAFSMEFKNNTPERPGDIFEACRNLEKDISFSLSLDFLNVYAAGWDGDYRSTKVGFGKNEEGFIAVQAYSHNRTVNDAPDVPEIVKVYTEDYIDPKIPKPGLGLISEAAILRMRAFKRIQKENKGKGLCLVLTEKDRNQKAFEKAEDIWEREFYWYGGHMIHVYCQQVVIQRRDLGLECVVRDKYFPERLGVVSPIKE